MMPAHREGLRHGSWRVAAALLPASGLFTSAGLFAFQEQRFLCFLSPEVAFLILLG
jgi:hypothetical protein